ncbi:MAG: YjjW family glycine radical enzyme activase [Turicibacter sp.]
MICYINYIIPFSSVDGPGNRTTIFLQGCNFNCVYCHNPETINKCLNCGACVKHCPTQALTLDSQIVRYNPKMCIHCDKCIKICQHDSSPKVLKRTAQDVINEISNYRPFITGITVSGGECTLQSDFLIELFQLAHELGLTCFIDTNGTLDLTTVPELLNVCDGIMLDVKVWNPDKHETYIGHDNSNVIKNLEYLIPSGKLYEVRTVVVPELFDNSETIDQVSKRIGTQPVRYKLIKFRALGVRAFMQNKPSPTDEFMQQLKEIAITNGCQDIVLV